MARCFAYDQNVSGKWSCKATVISCDGTDEKCPFFKTPQQHRAGKEAAYRRIATLPEWQQRAIADAHYSGEMPWRKYAEVHAGREERGAEAAERADQAVAGNDEGGAHLPGLLSDGRLYPGGKDLLREMRGEDGREQAEAAGV